MTSSGVAWQTAVPVTTAGHEWDNPGVTTSLSQSRAFEQILSALPQTQCTRCGYADCAGYARAIVSDKAAINQCPPGGAEGVKRLANITGLPAQPLNPANGVEGPRSVAVIDEAWCIGCTLCIKACPVDAIFGSNRQMHTVIESCCTGCELCLPVCPVDCINLENVTGEKTGWSAWTSQEAESARERYEFHSNKLNSYLPKETKLSEKSGFPEASTQPEPDGNLPLNNIVSANAARKRAMIEAALDRSRRQRQIPP